MSKPLSPREKRIAQSFFDTLRTTSPELTLVAVARDDDALVVQCVMPRSESGEEALRKRAWSLSGDVLLEHDQPIRLESGLFEVVIDLAIAGADPVRAAWPLYMQLASFVRAVDGGRVKGLAPGRGGRVEVTCRVRSTAFATTELVAWLAERGVAEGVRMQVAGPTGKPISLYPMNVHQPVLP